MTEVGYQDLSIKIIDEEIQLTRAELERYRREWQEAMRYTTAPVSLETYIRRQRAKTQPRSAHE